MNLPTPSVGDILKLWRIRKMNESFLLKTENASRLYHEYASPLPIIDFHNHISTEDIFTDKRFPDIVSLWLTPDPYKHRLMRICGVDEHYITKDAEPFEKFKKYCEIFPYLAGNPVYDWSRMELYSVFGIKEDICARNARSIYERTGEMLASEEFSARGILSRFNVEYQSPVARLTESLDNFDGITVAPSLRADDLLMPTDELKSELASKSGVAVTDGESYMRAVCIMLDRFSKKGCRFADHSLDANFFKSDTDGKRADMLVRLANEYAHRGWTLLLHVGAERTTSPRLRAIAGPAGGFAAAGAGFDVSALAHLLGRMEESGLPDTVLFPLNMADQAPLAVLQGSFSECGVVSKVQLGPAWWWCDHALGIKNTLHSIASFGVLSQFIGMTTDSRSILSFVRHDYFRRILCSFIDEQNAEGEWDTSAYVQAEMIRKICYQNAKDKIKGDLK